MGRKRVIKKEPTTSLSAYVLDAMILDDYQQSGETKPDALRRLFKTFFPPDVITAKKRELQKKLDRQVLLHGSIGDQSTIDNMYYRTKEFKDIEYTRRDIRDMILEVNPSKDPLAKRNADDSITKAVNKGFLEPTEAGKYKFITVWFKNER